MNTQLLKTAILGLSISFAATAALAGSETATEGDQAELFSIGEIANGGNGCPKGTLIAKTENNILSLELDSMLVVADAESTKLSRKSCALVIPIQSSGKIRITGLRAIYSGVAAVSENASLKVAAEHFFPGQKGRVLKATFEQTEPTQFNLQTPLLGLTSTCESKNNIRVNFSLLAQAKKIGDLAVGQIGTAKFQVLAEACE